MRSVTVAHDERALSARGEHLAAPINRARKLLRRHAAWWTLVTACAIVGALYGRALGFSFLFDDTFDLPRVEGRSYLSLLSSSEGYSYYRPIPFLLWKFTHDVLGFYSQPLLHLFTLAAHAVAGWLFFLLVARLGAGLWALVPALLFLTYPFSYQNVAIVGTLFHPLAAAAILASLNLFLSARRTTGRRALVFHLAAIGASAVALWSHESGIVVAPLVVGLEAVYLWQRRERRPSGWVLGHVGATLLFIVAWLTVERVPTEESVVLTDMHPKALFFMQGFTYPLTAQIMWLEDRLGWAPGILQMFGLALIIVGSAYVVAARVGMRSARQWLPRMAAPAAGLGIAFLAALPAVVRLSWPYVQDAPRLLYLVGIGAALFWGLLPMLSFRRRVVTLVWRGTTLLLLLGVVVQSWVFVERRMELFAIGSEAVDGIVAQGERHAGRGVVVVNAPSWLAQHEYEYPYGHLGVQVIPSYIGLDRVIYTSSRYKMTTNAASVAVNPVVDGDLFTFGPHGSEPTDQTELDGHTIVEVVRLEDRFEVRERGRIVRDVSRVGEAVVGSLRSAVVNGQLVVYLSWHFPDIPAETSVMVEIVDADGTIVGRYTGGLLAGVYQGAIPRPGDRVDDAYWFDLPAAGTYEVRAGIGTVPEPVGEIVVR